MTRPVDLRGRIGRVGLIADSHNNHAAMQACITRLRNGNATSCLVHLGDLFDSMQHSHLYEMVKTINRFEIAAVKGNNDFHIQNMLKNGSAMNIPDADKKKILSFLEHLPMKIVDDDVCFTHSLPFDSIRSLYEPVDNGTTDRAKQIFDQSPYHLVCCGHSHTPVLFRWRSGTITRELLNPEETVFLNPWERYIIVVGASDNGECGELDTGLKTYTRMCVPIDGQAENR
ncbi:MAG: metallophosphoesterase family protein [Desulfosalsimonadaceae bacterium]